MPSSPTPPPTPAGRKGGHNADLVKRLDTSSWRATPPGATRKRMDPHDFPGYGSHNIHHTPRHSEMNRISVLLEKELGDMNNNNNNDGPGGSGGGGSNSHLLHELEATAISGNDILSSTFYVSGLVTLTAGILAPVCLALVGFVLYLFRDIYHETVMALPCNGGTYNILLNCTTKPVASVAAIFAIIAYITTGVVSALEAVAYLDTVVQPYMDIPKQTATILLLAFFCALTNWGMKESAAVAKGIFVAHVGTLFVLSALGTLHTICNPRQLVHNWSTNTPSFPIVNMAGNWVPGTVGTALFYGFSSAMLGVSGFETSSQFVEEQAPGVFPKTLRNMWWGVMLFNPLLSLISFSALSLDDIIQHPNTVLAQTAMVVGEWLQASLTGNIPHSASAWNNFGVVLSTLVSIDAFVVLAAALLTGYVGINGLIRRMSMDRCLPQFFLWKNPVTHTDSIILVGFFLLCVSQVVILDSNVEALGGVYCYAFLTVMIIFAYGNILLKIKRPSLPREVTTGWLHSIVGLLSVVLALLGNILGKPELLVYFFVYCGIVGALVWIMFQRVRILRLLFKLLKPKQSSMTGTRQGRTSSSDDDDNQEGEETPLVSQEEPVPPPLPNKDLEVAFGDESSVLSPQKPRLNTSDTNPCHGNCLLALSQAVQQVQDVPFVFFIKHDDLHVLNKAMLYIQNNEQTNKIIVVHCKGGLNKKSSSTSGGGKVIDPEEHTASLTEHVKLIDLLYPRVKISLLMVNAEFSNVTVEWLSQALAVPINAMFISCPDENFAMKVSQLRGMRIIFSYD